MITRAELDLAEARRVVDAVLAHASATPGAPIAVAVVDREGELICFARMDLTTRVARQMAVRKAYTAACIGIDSAEFGQRLADQGRSPSELGDRNLVGVRGGVAVVDDGAVLGGVGVSGRSAEDDEQLARAGLTALIGAC